MKINHIDIESLLMPITSENPAGISLEYEPLYDEIVQARKSDSEDASQGEWSIAEPHRADWDTVLNLCGTGLIHQGKDLQIACWYTEAITHLYGLEGTDIGLNFLHKFLKKFWLHCWPSLEDEGFSYRTAILSHLDRDISQHLYLLPLLEKETSSLANWHRVQSFEHRLATRPEMKSELIAQEGDLTLATFNQIHGHASPVYIRKQAEQVANILAQLVEMEKEYLTISQQQTAQLFTRTQNTLNEIKVFLQRWDSDPAQDTPAEIPLPDTAGVGNVALLSGQAAMTRINAIQQIQAVAYFFRKTEPSSPVPFLLERAVRWANMPLTEWLDEVLAHSSSLSDIHSLLQGKTPSCSDES